MMFEANANGTQQFEENDKTFQVTIAVTNKQWT